MTIVNASFAIRAEQPHHHEQIRATNQAAFGRPDEAELIDRLRNEGVVLLSLIAETDSRIIGHILFSRMTIETENGSLEAVSLAPVAVMPEHQNRQVGSQLIRHGLAELRDRGERIVIVLGDKNYYPRFGFSSEKAGNLISPFPADAFMALELADNALSGVSGVVRYAAAFGL